MSAALRALPPALALCGVLVAVDQGSKALVESLLARGQREEVLPFLAFENTRNRGVAFGLAGDVPPLVIGATIGALVLLLAVVALQAGRPAVWLPAGLLLGGALANLSDRVRQGAVTDFIDLPLWPTFNLADLAIVAGVIVLFFLPERRPP